MISAAQAAPGQQYIQPPDRFLCDIVLGKHPQAGANPLRQIPSSLGLQLCTILAQLTNERTRANDDLDCKLEVVDVRFTKLAATAHA